VELAAQQLLRALRGERSQQAFARRIGYRGNPSTHWEHGRRFPTAVETLRFAKKLGVEVPAAFRRFYPALELEESKAGFELSRWLDELRGKTSVTDLATRLGRSRSTVSRWLSGSAKPRLPEFLEYLDVTTGRLPDWVAELVPIEQVPALHAQYQAAQIAKRLAFEQPWTEALLRVLETEQYAAMRTHDVNWIAELLDLGVSEVNAGLEALESADIVRWQGGKYQQLKPLSVDTRGGRAALYRVKAHWSKVAAARALAPGKHDLFAYNVCSASSADMERVREVLRRAYAEVRSIIAASEPPQEIALVNLQLLSWPAAKKA
jgi:transcriptional regulator with XRE-family HTH domain